MEVVQTVPILRIFDVAKAKEFCLDYLGFRVDWEHRFEPGLPLYMQISKYGCVLHLSEHYGDATPGASVFLRVTGKLMQLTDPFGNRLRFNEDLK